MGPALQTFRQLPCPAPESPHSRTRRHRGGSAACTSRGPQGGTCCRPGLRTARRQRRGCCGQRGRDTGAGVGYLSCAALWPRSGRTAPRPRRRPPPAAGAGGPCAQRDPRPRRPGTAPATAWRPRGDGHGPGREAGTAGAGRAAPPRPGRAWGKGGAAAQSPAGNRGRAGAGRCRRELRERGRALQPGAAPRESAGSAAGTACFLFIRGGWTPQLETFDTARKARRGQRPPRWIRAPKVFHLWSLTALLPRCRPSPAFSGSRHFVLQEEFELLRSDVWLRCEIFVKGHVAEIDLKTDLFQLEVMLLDLSKSTGVNFKIICGRLKLSR